MAGVLPGHFLEALDALEFPFERPVILKRSPPNDFGGAQNPRCRAPRQPDLAIGPGANAPEQVVIGDPQEGVTARLGTWPGEHARRQRRYVCRRIGHFSWAQIIH